MSVLLLLAVAAGAVVGLALGALGGGSVLAAPALAGVAAGHLPEALLTGAFAAVAALAAAAMLRPAQDRAPGPVHPARAAGAGAGLAAVTGFLGVGGGFLAVPALKSVLALPMRKAVATSLLVITVNSLAALTARTGSGDGLDWAVIAPFTAVAVVGAWDGKRLGRKSPPAPCRRSSPASCSRSPPSWSPTPCGEHPPTRHDGSRQRQE